MKASQRYWIRHTAASGCISIPMAVFAALYLADVLALTASGWLQLIGIVAVLIPPTFAVSLAEQRRRVAPLLRWMDEGPYAEPERNAEAFRGFARFPRVLLGSAVLGWLGGGLLAAAAAWVWIPEFGPWEFVATMGTCLGASLFSALLSYLVGRALLHDPQQRAAALVPVDARADAAARVPIGWKLTIAFFATGVVPLLLCAVLVYSSEDSVASLKVQLPVVTLLSGIFAILLAWLFARDLTSNLRELSEAVDRLAQGDLRAPVLVESDDEIGELAHSCARMSDAVGEAVHRMSAAAERIEGVMATLGDVGLDLDTGSRHQREGALTAVRAFEEIESEVGELRERSVGLGRVVENSASATGALKISGEEVRDMSGQLSGGIEDAVQALGQIAESTSSITDQVKQLSRLASEAHAGTDELSEGAAQIDREAEGTGRLAQRVVDHSEVGRDRVRRTGEGMRSIQASVASGEETIESLRREVAEIRSVLKLIDDVADETQLLSLNAAIIAAQAGENGRAFAVVAEEVKALAEAVGERIQEIAGTIASVEKGTDAAATAMKRSRTAVDHGITLAGEAETALDEIATSARDSVERVGLILQTLQEQGDSTRQIRARIEAVAGGMNEIESAALEQGASQAEVVEAAGSIREVSQRVHRSTDEQARGIETIRADLAAVKEVAQAIDHGLGRHVDANTRSRAAIDEQRDRAERNLSAVGRLGESLASLEEEAESLRAEVARFQLEDAAPEAAGA